MRSLSRGVIGALGFAFGIWFVISSPFHGKPLWVVWAPLLVGSTGAAGLVFNYGLNRWAELVSCRDLGLRKRDVAGRIAFILGIVIAPLVAAAVGRGPLPVGWRHVELASVLLLGSVPAAGVMGGIRHVASQVKLRGTRGKQVVQLVRLRDLLQRVLAAVGSIVALSTLAVGASVLLQQRLAPRSGHLGNKGLPPHFVLIVGGIGSLIVALFYVPAATALQKRGQRLCDELFPPSTSNEPAAILSAADNRQKLGQLLGADRNIVTDLQAGVAILAPLLASAAAVFLSP